MTGCTRYKDDVCFITAHDAKSGKEVWRTSTVARPGEPGGDTWGDLALMFRAGADAPGQEGTLHFRYLLREHGGFVIDALTLDEHVARLGRVLRGDDDGSDDQQRFVERFVRPAGLTRPASPLVASAILQLTPSEPVSVAP